MSLLETPFAALPRQRRKQARPQELLDAALDLFVRKGFAATRIEEVAAGAGVSKGTIYLYYPSKDELLKAVIRHYLSSEISAGAAQLDSHAGSMTEMLVSVLPQWWLRLFESPASGVFKLVVTEVRNFPDIAAMYTQEVIEPAQGLIRRILERGMASGEFRSVDLDSAVHSLLLPMVMLCLHKHSVGACPGGGARIDPLAFVHNHIALLLSGLAAPSAASPAPKKSKRP